MSESVILRCLNLDFNQKGRCGYVSTSSSSEQLLQLASGEICNLTTWKPMAQWPIKTPITRKKLTLLKAKSSLYILGFILSQKDLATAQELMIAQRKASSRNLVVEHTKRSELRPVPFLLIERWKCHFLPVRQFCPVPISFHVKRTKISNQCQNLNKVK